MPALSSDRFLGREGAPEVRVKRLEAGFLIDESSKRYIDFVMGWCVGNFGWRNQTLRWRAARFDGPDTLPPG
jgi:acetylornithine/succinyldiaminopimelate/putrescine aminotransferase